jgi:hypothetical protein
MHLEHAAGSRKRGSHGAPREITLVATGVTYANAEENYGAHLHVRPVNLQVRAVKRSARIPCRGQPLERVHMVAQTGPYHSAWLQLLTIFRIVGGCSLRRMIRRPPPSKSQLMTGIIPPRSSTDCQANIERSQASYRLCYP